MHRLLATAPLCLALAACATAAADKPAICDGRHRRPANPNGSVLVMAASPIGPVGPANDRGGKRPAGLAQSFAPCGGGR